MLSAADGAGCRSVWSECVPSCVGNSTITRTRSATAVCIGILVEQQQQSCVAPDQCGAVISGNQIAPPEDSIL